MPLLAEGLQLIAQLRQRRIVAGGQAGERDLLIAGVVAGADAVVGAEVAAAIADRAVDIARLTEAAAADAAPEQLQGDTVLDDLGGGDDGIYREIGLVHVVDDALCHHGRCAVTGRDGRHGAVVVIGHIVKGRDIDTVQPGSGAEKIGLAPALAAGAAVELHQLHGDVLALAQADQIDEVGQGLGVVHGGAAGDDQRGQAGAVRGVEGNVGQVQHIEDGGKGHLVANGEGHNVIVGDGVAGFQGKKGHFRLTQLGLHVAPGSEHALAPDAGDIVHYAVEDTHTQVGHTDLVGIREAEGNAGVYRRLVLEDGVVFAAHVAGGLLHPGQDAFQSFIHGVVLSPPLPDGAWAGSYFL